MKTLESFTKKNKPKRRTSKLKKFENEIRELYKKEYRVEQIQEFLEKNGIKVARSYLYEFLKLNKTLSTEKFSFKNPVAPKSKTDDKIKKEIKGGKAMGAFLDNIKKTAEAIKKNKEKER